ncbi:intercellular trafficking and secretion [Malassezia cuniculi]|uniref:Sorting nexin-4 n=1 Tax=Malassezia cuniculi TaxID=948313 RepID=A0AAF0EUD2_9BASI|nr:intercellular trafficking and secretion [Malassezia cuniculi]
MGDHPELKWLGSLRVSIVEPRKETTQDGTEGRAPAFVSYGIVAETTLPHFARSYMATRKRFRDFAFLHDALVRDFPMCVVPPLPDKHHIESLAGDRFADDFIQRRCSELQLFMERICRHPTLQRARILQLFLESSEWYIDMHAQRGHPIASASGAPEPDVPAPAESQSSLLESLSDSVMNAFSRVRKPDPAFVEMARDLEQREDTLSHLDRVVNRIRFHTADDSHSGQVVPLDDIVAMPVDTLDADMGSDYGDLATALEQLGVLESGMTSEFEKTAEALRSFGSAQRDNSLDAIQPVSSRLRSLLAYSAAHRSALRQRDLKQVDFEGLTDYLASMVTERDRLVTLGHGGGGNVRGPGIGGYLRSTVDRALGVDEEQARIERIQRLEARITELQNAVSTTYDSTRAFNTQLAQENTLFKWGLQRELKETLEKHVQGHVDMYARGADMFDALLKKLEEEDDGDESLSLAGSSGADAAGTRAYGGGGHEGGHHSSNNSSSNSSSSNMHSFEPDLDHSREWSAAEPT